MARRTRLAGLSALVLCGVAAGLVLAAAAFPVTALSGLVAKATGDSFDSLPAALRVPPSQQASYLYASDGKTLITTFYDQNRTDVALDDIAPVMRKAIVAAEDTRFYQHGGVDPRGVVRALVANGSNGGVSQGASTLTMQYVRNVLKTDPRLSAQERAEATQDTAARKLTEMRYAVALEQKLSKDEILRRYLNIAYFGNGAYGIYAASQAYFSVPPSKLTLAQAALLAGLVQSPDADNPVRGDRQAALDRRAYVLGAMAKAGDISRATATRTAKAPLRLDPGAAPPNDCVSVPSAHDDWGFFCDYVKRWWDAQPAFGRTVAERENALRQGGYRIVTSLSPDVQATALAQSLSVYGYDNPRALPMAVVQPGTGRVLSLAVNRHFSLAANPSGQNGYPNTTAQLVAGGGGVDGYQAGSTFKMFTMLAALDAGMPLSTSFDAPSRLQTKWPDSGPASCGGYYCPGNDNPSWMDGTRTMWTGYGRSVNTYFVWLEEQVGADRAVAMAKRLGITFRADSDAERAATSASSWGSFTLGVADTTPLDLANAYATVAADGKYCTPTPVVSITDANGRKLSAGQPDCRQAVSADVARAATDAARCPVGQQSYAGECDGGTAPSVGQVLSGRQVGGKTGSAENNATETFVGFTPQVAAAGIAANPSDPSDYVGAGVSDAVDQAVARTMRTALAGQPAVDFGRPPARLTGG
ncbi:transglycosylase domain-containing protein [Actinocatenispora rupis]|uniref:Penicillin-binding protein n=1 Tax=Actinocatenispora rupis TaxID=519421 RepID=A0A8J3N7Y2_9ACTN|nr:transglycosylase domain-containing protein [Actinocatenispora rupis]GID09546.1 penicillin-binding protein [Actinocatenispora rupis]